MTSIELSLLALILAPAVLAAGHALLYKRDPRAAFGWIAVSLAMPLAGPLLYFLFGINRIRTRAQKLRERGDLEAQDRGERPEILGPVAVRPAPAVSESFTGLVRVSEALTRRPLAAGNTITVLHNGEQVYPAMLAAIDAARQNVFFSTYIYRADEIGVRFADALGRAVQRGLDVRVIVDGLGQMYSVPFGGTVLRRRGVPIETFLPPRLFPPSIHLNLRNHRKILTIDGTTGFTGGVNISDHHFAAREDDADRIVDLHCRLDGPIVRQLEDVFLQDWAFCSGRRDDQRPAGIPPPSSGALCRVITDGPDDDFGKLTSILVGAVTAARRSIAIMSPYLLPPRELIAGLQSAALRGVDVVVVLPGRNDLPFVHWATRNMLWELLQYGVRVYYQPPPFVHTKLLVIDDEYAQIGSSNIDPRSLRLNFELVVEIFDRDVAGALAKHAAVARAGAREVTLEEVDGRSLPVRVRDAVAWLFSPYL